MKTNSTSNSPCLTSLMISSFKALQETKQGLFFSLSEVNPKYAETIILHKAFGQFIEVTWTHTILMMSYNETMDLRRLFLSSDLTEPIWNALFNRVKPLGKFYDLIARLRCANKQNRGDKIEY
jgi:hypothetical protein